MEQLESPTPEKDLYLVGGQSDWAVTPFSDVIDLPESSCLIEWD